MNFEADESFQPALGSDSIMKSTFAGIVGIMFGLIAAGCAKEREFNQNFRDSGFDFERLQLIGVNAQRHVMPEPGGLRMVLPGNKKVPLVGVTPRFRVRGDFEVTADFVINQVGKPSAGYGVGATIYLLADSDGKEAASMGRLQRTKEGDVFVAMHGITPSGGKRIHNVKFFPTKAKSGKLRIVRTDSMLYYLFAEEYSPDFKELFQTQFTNADIVQVRLGADSGGATSALDMSWNSLSIYSQGFPDLDEVQSWAWLYLLGFILSVGFMGAMGVWIWRRKRG